MGKYQHIITNHMALCHYVAYLVNRKIVEVDGTL